MRLFLRFIGWIFAGGTIVFLVGVTAVAGLLWHFSKELPDYSQLQDYEPAVMTRVHAADGQLLAEYARERRLYLPIQAVPRLVINAFIAAEDKSFYEHGGLDFSGMARAGLAYIQNYGSGRRAQGASTITQQVAKNIFLWEGRPFVRKGLEAYLTIVLEVCLSKERILDIYLNLAEWGDGVFGAEEASRFHFGVSAADLGPDQAARLAAILPAPRRWQIHGQWATTRAVMILGAMERPAPRP
jgi:penicillin-binding protein 1A